MPDLAHVNGGRGALGVRLRAVFPQKRARFVDDHTFMEIIIVGWNFLRFCKAPGVWFLVEDVVTLCACPSVCKWCVCVCACACERRERAREYDHVTGQSGSKTRGKCGKTRQSIGFSAANGVV